MKTIKQRLHAKDALLLINNIDIIHTYIECSDFHYVSYNYKREKTIHTLLSFLLYGEDFKGREGNVCFQIDLTIDDLKKLDGNKIIDITSHLSDMEPSFVDPSIGKYDFMNFNFETNKEEDMFKRFSKLYVYKKEDDTFIFKLLVPSDDIFAVFTIKF